MPETLWKCRQQPLIIRRFRPCSPCSGRRACAAVLTAVRAALLRPRAVSIERTRPSWLQFTVVCCNFTSAAPQFAMQSFVRACEFQHTEASSCLARPLRAGLLTTDDPRKIERGQGAPNEHLLALCKRALYAIERQPKSCTRDRGLTRQTALTARVGCAGTLKITRHWPGAL